MKHVTPNMMMSFTDELQKDAGIGNWLRAAKGFARNPITKSLALANKEIKGKRGRQVLLGTGVGAAGGAAVADPNEPGGRLKGALKGALLGGGITGGRVLATSEGRKAAKKGFSDFGQRQRYALTGKGLGKTDAAKMRKAEDIGLLKKPDLAGMDPKQVTKANKLYAAEQDALKKGYMSAPGVVQGMLTRPGDVLKSGWQRSGMLGKGFAGLGAYEAGSGVLEKPTPGGPGRLEKGLRGAGSAVGWMVAPSTLVGSQLVGMGGGYLGGKAGKVGDAAVRAARRPGQVVPRGGY